MNQLSRHDLQWILRRLPVKVLELMKAYPGKVFLAGGFVRACVANEKVEDIDLFVPDKELAKVCVQFLREKEGGSTEGPKFVWSSDNAYTVKGFKHPIQIIHRWTYTNVEDCIKSFDFTIAMSAVWWAEQLPSEGEWRGLCHPDFYPDLAAKRLVYTSPDRNEDAGGSMLRVLKFYQRGYRIPLDSLGAVISRLLRGVDIEQVLFWEGRNVGYSDRVPQDELDKFRAKILSGLLREVDPNVDPSHIAHLPSLGDDTPATPELF